MPYTEIALILCTLVVTWNAWDLREHQKAINFLEKRLDMQRDIIRALQGTAKEGNKWK